MAEKPIAKNGGVALGKSRQFVNHKPNDYAVHTQTIEGTFFNFALKIKLKLKEL